MKKHKKTQKNDQTTQQHQKAHQKVTLAGEDRAPSSAVLGPSSTVLGPTILQISRVGCTQKVTKQVKIELQAVGDLENLECRFWDVHAKVWSAEGLVSEARAARGFGVVGLQPAKEEG